MLRSVIALIAGFAIMTFTILVITLVVAEAMDLERGAPTRSYLIINVVYSAAAAIFGGYSTAALAPARHFEHACVLAAMVGIATVSSIITPAPGQPTWYLVALLVTGPACAALGGFVRDRQVARRASPTAAPPP